MSQTSRVALLSLTILLWGSPWLAPVAAADEPRPRPESHPPAPPPAPPPAHPPAQSPAQSPTYPSHPPAQAPSHPSAHPPSQAPPYPSAQHPPAYAPARPTTLGPSVDGRGQVLDARHNHGRYYPPAGTTIRSLPPGYRPYYHGGERYYLNGGVWYAPRGPGFVVITPPVGLVISVLPPYYSTVWIGGIPYYYADNVYYTWQPDQNGYAVAAPPDNADQDSLPPDGDAGQPVQGPQPEFFIYPKNGQTKDQQAADEYECHNWARTQTGFDPTQPGGGVPAGDADRSHNNYERAMSACLQGRGYQVD